jgi:hypothetical protein
LQNYDLMPGANVWVFQAGWTADLPKELRRFPQFRDLRYEAFGRNIKIFKATEGRSVRSPSP